MTVGLFFRSNDILTPWAAPCENVSSGICGQRMPRSACASEHLDQVLYCWLPESLDTTKCMNEEHKPGLYLRM